MSDDDTAAGLIAKSEAAFDLFVLDMKAIMPSLIDCPENILKSAFCSGYCTGAISMAKFVEKNSRRLRDVAAQTAPQEN